jgi:hypothetical protein
MGNLLDDYTSGKIDLIVHMGGESFARGFQSINPTRFR